MWVFVVLLAGIIMGVSLEYFIYSKPLRKDHERLRAEALTLCGIRQKRKS